MSNQGLKRSNSNISQASSPSLSPAQKKSVFSQKSPDHINYHSTMAEINIPDITEEELKQETKLTRLIWQKLSSMDDNLSQMNTCHTLLESRVERIEENTGKVLKSTTVLEKKVCVLEHENAQLKDRIQSSEIYSRKYNLLFINVPEEREENPGILRRKISNILSRVHVNLENMYLDNIHRLPAPSAQSSRPIIIKFVSYLDRDLVWGKSKQLRESGSNITIREHFPKEVENNIRQLLPIRKAAKIQGKSVKMNADKLIIDKKQYTVKNLDTLPPALRPEAVATRILDNHTFFFTGVSPFSNFHFSEFTLNQVKYSRGEQFIQHQKAIMFGDKEKADAIMAAKTPNEMKRLGGEVSKKSTFSQSVWRASAPKIMADGLEEKFRQNPQLKECLLNTGNTKMVEAAKSDSFWGIGRGMYDADLMRSKESWGTNVLGQILTDIRDMLREEDKSIEVDEEA
jgi:ribA/ribD-fused uncharacterized protein